MSLILPWPPRECSPNWRGHWASRAAAVKRYRAHCWALAKEARLRIDWEGDVHLWLDFVPPDKRARDDDNIIASFKGGRDGLADALGIDDKRFRAHPYVATETMRGGGVRVRVTPGPT